MEQNDRRPVRRADFGIADTEFAGVDLLERAERRFVRANADVCVACCAAAELMTPSWATAAPIAATPRKRRRR